MHAVAPPVQPPPAPELTAAPVPDRNLDPPNQALDPGVNVVPGNLQLHFPPMGNGYLPNSSSQALDNSHTPKVPGVTLSVPLGAPGDGSPP